MPSCWLPRVTRFSIRTCRWRATTRCDSCHHLFERQYGTFSRSFSLPASVDPSRVAADYKNGVLTVKMPMREEAKPRQVKVDVAA